MRFDWSTLGREAPAALVRARHLAHHAAQWPAKAARANLPAAADDSHASLVWDDARAALMSQPMPGAGAEVRIGLRIAGLELLVVRGGVVLDTYTLEGRTDAMIGVWFDSALRALGLEPASDCALPYSVAHHPATKRSAQVRGADAGALEELARWYAAADDVLHEAAAGFPSMQPESGLVRCWPHHFDIAILVTLDEGTGEAARSIGIGFSPGDQHYPQPYAYVSPRPPLNTTNLPDLPPPGRWHTHGFIGAVATGEDILMLGDRRQELVDFLDAAAKIGRAELAA